jgi:peroxiredoxin Q/BCP
LLSVVSTACDSPRRPDGGEGLLPAGAAVPELSAQDQNGAPVALRGRSEPAVVYFYPKDGTPGCTKEACAFRDAWKAFERAKVTVVGVSTDSRESHQQFAREHEIPFSLISDEDGTWAKAFGVETTMGLASRVSFVISNDKVFRTYPDVDPAVHASEVLADAERARSSQ